MHVHHLLPRPHEVKLHYDLIRRLRLSLLVDLHPADLSEATLGSGLRPLIQLQQFWL